MDERTLNELLECSVCLDRLDTTSKVLPCQHTFCRRCLEEIISTKHELRCPECRYLVEMRVEDLPANILLIRLLEGMKTFGSTSGSSASSPSSPSKRFQPGGGKSSPLKSGFQSQPCAKALYNYDAKEQGDLAFKKGDIISLKKQVDENWFHGEKSGQSGFFPATYVQVLVALPVEEPPKCTALFDFIINDQNEKDCLTFHKDEVITVIRRVDEHWAEGRLDDRIGIFPISFVDFNDSAKWLLNNPPQSLILNSSSQNSTPSTSNISGQSSSTNNGSSCQAEACGSNSNQVVSTTTGPVTSQSPVVTPTEVTVGILITTAASPVSSTNTLMALATASSLSNQGASANKRHSLTTISNQKMQPSANKHRHSMELPLNSDTLPLSQIPMVVTPMRCDALGVMSSVTPVVMTSSLGETSGASSSSRTKSSLPAICMALYNYKPQKSDEVELVKNGYYTVSEKCQDGWYKGACLRTGRAGVFPGNYVQMVRLSSAMKTSVANAMLASLANSSITSRAVNRTQSFPKTSPHHKGPMSSSVLASGVNSLATSPEVSNMHNNLRSPSHPGTKLPSRTITNVTQAHTRSASASMTSQALPGTSGVGSTSIAHASIASVPLVASPRVSALISGSGTTSDGGNTSPVHSRDPIRGTVSRDDSHICMNTSRSPRPTRRYKRSSAKERSKSSVSAVNKPQISSTDTNTTSTSSSTRVTSSIAPNIVVGAMGDNEEVAGATASAPVEARHGNGKEKKERKQMAERLAIMKRLASHGIPLKGRKSKSPPPQLLQPPRPQPRHQRSGSEGSIMDGPLGAMSCIPTPQRRSEQKPLKIKPLHRERYRCIDPYPPQSDIELELKAGDIVYIHKKRDDGWFKGTHARTGKTGLFPGCFVEKM